MTLKYQGYYLKNINKISRDTVIYSYVGFPKIFIYSALIMIHPVYMLRSNEIIGITEYYWDGSMKIPFIRDYNEYLLLLNLNVHFFNFFALVIRLTKWGSP